MLKWLATAAANGVAFLVASSIALTVAYRLSNSPIVLLFTLSVAFGAFGALTRVWSPAWTAVAIPAAAVSLFVVIVLTMEMYLGDGGDSSIMWRYIPGVEGLVAAVVVSACGLGGWVLLGRVRAEASKRASHAAEQ